MKLDYSKISDVEVDGINFKDFPDFCDAYISAASYDGREMTEDELDVINADFDYVHECVRKIVY